MKGFLSVCLAVILLLPILSIAQSELPESREATLVETTSPTEVMVRAKGIGHHDPGGLFKSPDPKVMNRRAERDALKSAVYFLLFNAGTPILQMAEEKLAFQNIQDNFFQEDHLRKFIAWESPQYSSRVKLNETSVKVEKSYRINKQAIIDELVQKGIIAAREDLVSKVGKPYIMVLPETQDGGNPMEKLGEPKHKKAAEVIESYLTSRQYDVLVPEQVQANNAMQQTATFMSGMEDDYSYQLALSIGSDIYITYSVNVESRKVGNTKVAKASVGVRAYETTTARLLGTETGYSEERPGSEMVLIEEAVNNAVDQALNKLQSYWKSDLERGVQFKLVVSLGSGFDGDTAEDIAWGFGDILEEVTKDYKENVISAKTLDYLIWCNPDEYKRSSDVYRALKERFQNEALPGGLDRNAINRKLLLLTIKE
ncbi:MAG: DUF6175 family protein [Candidatus Marinimicrobia bacterium]|nr:DUF6175 family protein [Candidatus Neomarinimicrobiota bacterium]MCF7829474.1 DUF6175 family protein [Candidatus Neomarinimicrobiota bacterium]MCF7880128.1 DUF6175 family protein [Candidatus Neomarinimicrobiota bacterium]